MKFFIGLCFKKVLGLCHTNHLIITYLTIQTLLLLSNNLLVISTVIKPLLTNLHLPAPFDIFHGILVRQKNIFISTFYLLKLIREVRFSSMEMQKGYWFVHDKQVGVTWLAISPPPRLASRKNFEFLHSVLEWNIAYILLCQDVKFLPLKVKDHCLMTGFEYPSW